MEELIKRSDAIKAIEALAIHTDERYLNDLEYGHNEGLAHAIDRIEDIPSADRPQGEWITTLSGHWKCSRCNCRAGFWFEEENSCEWDMDMSEWLSDYCPNCGAKMKGADK